MEYGIIKSGGKQVKVVPGESIWVEKLDVEVGTEHIFEDVLMVFDGKEMKVGNPFVKNAKIVATVEKQGKNPKLTIFRTKAKSNWSTKKGHRQPYTRLLIKEIKI